jgi:AraC family transcriptional regulator of adaptative response/methylated-DNA-[protein]-cysteine methyltransferase
MPTTMTAARPTDVHLALAERVRAHIDAHAGAALPLAQLAADVGVSAAHLQRTFMRVVKGALREGSTVSAATYEAGFASGRRVYEAAAETLGMTPGAYRRRGAGIEIHYTIVATSLGRLLVALTERGICGVSLGDDDDRLTLALHEEFPSAEIVRTTDASDRLVDAVIAHVEGEAGVALALPLDVRATAFQWQVWRALQRIPAGATRSYQELATELGRPTAARAVARACASNRVAVLIPCHRVIRGDGELGGYRWGLARKAALLARERAPSTPAP